MILAFCYKLKPSLSQQRTIAHWMAMLRSHYNYCLADRIGSYEEVRSPKLGEYCDLRTKAVCSPLSCAISKNSNMGEPFKGNGKRRNAYEMQSSELPILKKSRPWYATISSTVLQQNLRRLNDAFEGFFNGKGYPAFKRRNKFKSFSYAPNQVQFNPQKVYLPKIGWMRFFKSRAFPNGFTPKTVTVRQKADGYYISVRLEDKTVPDFEPMEIDRVKSIVGIDLGARPHKLCCLSTGENIPNPMFAKQSSKRRTLLHRRASRKVKGSKNQKKAYQKLSKFELGVINQRNDYQWKVGHQLVRKFDAIVMEALQIQNMTRRCKPKLDEQGKYLKNGQSAKRALSRLIQDCSWEKLKGKIRQVAEKCGRIFLEVEPKFSSQTCSSCGFKSKENRKKESFLCLNCGMSHDADTNASLVLATRGIEKLGISENTLWGVTPKVTATSETSEVTRNSQEIKSVALATEPSNPLQRAIRSYETFI